MATPPPNLIRNLVNLRWFAIAGQSATIALAVYGFGVPLSAAPLWLGIGVLAAFNVGATLFATRMTAIGPAHVMAHIAVDVVVLAWQIAWSGGAMNPFTSLFVLPIALVAIALPIRWVIATALLCASGYGAAAAFGQPLPHMHDGLDSAMNLHLWGMAANFVISATVVTVFLTRVASALRAREAEVARLREQSARNEGIVALATHAASVAHELNTPLGALTLLIEDQLDPTNLDDRAKRDDLQTMADLVNDCRDRVLELAAPARAMIDGSNLTEAIDRVIARWQLLRPNIELTRSGAIENRDHAALDPGIGHLLQALLNNAADASESAGHSAVALHIDLNQNALSGTIRDYGTGLDSDNPAFAGRLFHSTKATGLGVGLVLSHATVERLGGSLTVAQADGGGTAVRFHFPLSAESADST